MRLGLLDDVLALIRSSKNALDSPVDDAVARLGAKIDQFFGFVSKPSGMYREDDTIGPLGQPSMHSRYFRFPESPDAEWGLELHSDDTFILIAGLSVDLIDGYADRGYQVLYDFSPWMPSRADPVRLKPLYLVKKRSYADDRLRDLRRRLLSKSLEAAP